jgi:hypothetical protein
MNPTPPHPHKTPPHRATAVGRRSVIFDHGLQRLPGFSEWRHISNPIEAVTKVAFIPERKIETTKDTNVRENQSVENLTALTLQVWMRLPSSG